MRKVQNSSARPPSRYSGPGKPAVRVRTGLREPQGQRHHGDHQAEHHNNQRAGRAPVVVVAIQRPHLLVRAQHRCRQPAAAADVRPHADHQLVAGQQQIGCKRKEARHLGKVAAVELRQIPVLLQQGAVEPDFIGVAQPGYVEGIGAGPGGGWCEVNFKGGRTGLPRMAPVPVIGQRHLGRRRLARHRDHGSGLAQLMDRGMRVAPQKQEADQPNPDAADVHVFRPARVSATRSPPAAATGPAGSPRRPPRFWSAPRVWCRGS